MRVEAEIMNELEALSLHYVRPVRTPEEQTRFLQDYVADLAPFPVEAIKSACRRWRQGDAAKFPTPGQLMAFVRQAVPSRADPTAAAPWRPLSSAEYDRLTLSEKIRHRRILAVEARRKAGPMWLNGRPATTTDLPQSWHDWRAKAENHEAEARRLREILDQRQAETERQTA